MRRRAAIAVLLVVAAGGLFALFQRGRVSAGGGVEVLRGATMGTTYSVKYGAAPAADGGATRTVDAEAMARGVEEVLADIDATFSTYRDDSELARLNAHRALEPFAVSPQLAALLRLALEIAAKTEGAFDPTVEPLVALYGFKERKLHRPTEAELAAALARVGYDKLRVLDDGRVQKAIPDVELDLSALAKGYAVDRVVERVLELGASGCMVEIGGEVRCAGTKPDGSRWRIGIEKPPPPGEPARELEQTVELLDAAIATSGSYRNVLDDRAGAVHHIFDPRTGRNAPSAVRSASVRASTCALADGLATAFMVLGPTAAERVLARFEDPRLGLLIVAAAPPPAAGAAGAAGEAGGAGAGGAAAAAGADSLVRYAVRW